MERVTENLIAPCGMNCGVCSGHLREKDSCPGCQNNPTPGYCQHCKMRLCDKRTGKYCSNCEDFPCKRLKQLDKRYREKYEMSEIDNLEFIRDRGIEAFVDNERKRWESEKGIYCVHNKKYY